VFGSNDKTIGMIKAIHSIKILISLLFIYLNNIEAQDNIDTNTIEGIKKMIRQSTYYDSVKVFYFGEKAIKMAKAQKSLSDEATIYQYYGNFCYFSKNYPLSEKYYQQSLLLSNQAGDNELSNKTKIRMAFIRVDENMLQAEKEFNEILIEAEKGGFIENQIECYNGLGIIYEQRQMYDRSIDFYLKGLKLAEDNEQHYHEAMLLNNIGLIKLYSNQREGAKNDFERALKVAYELQELRLALNLHNNLGLVNTELSDHEGAIAHYKQTLVNAHELGFPVVKGVAHLNLSNSYFKLKDIPNALIYVDSSLYIFTHFHERNFLPKTYLMKAVLLREINELSTAYALKDSALKYAQLIASFADEIEVIQVEASLKAKEGNFQEAYELHKKYHQLNDSLQGVNNKDKVAQLQVLFGKEQLEAQLENERNLKEAEKREKEFKTRQATFIVIIIGILSIIIAILIYLRYLATTKKQQEQFTQQLIQQIDEERSRIARDLHDGVGQLLSSIKMKSSIIKQQGVPQMQQMELELGEVIDQTRSISHTLHPSSLEKIGLKRSVAALLEKIQQNSNIVCTMEWEEQSDRLPIEMKTQLYRILQECINNTLKHANATALKITFYKAGSSYELTYRDNGVGKSGQELNKGIGLRTIEERVRKIGGKVHFEFNTGKGFKMEIKC
jgi:two-component system, NarL family, sensor kinase